MARTPAEWDLGPRLRSGGCADPVRGPFGGVAIPAAMSCLGAGLNVRKPRLAHNRAAGRRRRLTPVRRGGYIPDERVRNRPARSTRRPEGERTMARQRTPWSCGPRPLVLRCLLALPLVLLPAACGRVAPTYEPASLTVRSLPAGADIVLDGQPTGEVTPHTFTGLEATTHEVSVALTEWFADPESIEVDLAPLDDVSVDFALFQTGLRVTSDPSGARILIDGTDTGRVTPAVVAGLTAGTVDVSLALDTYLCVPASVPVTVVQGSVVEVPAASLRLRSQRTVILESFGNMNCATCPQAAEALYGLTQRTGYGPDRALFVEFAVNWPSPVDPFYLANPTEQADRYIYYFVMGAPVVYVDGAVQPDALDADAVAASVAAKWQADPGFLLDLEATVGVGSAVPVTVTLTPHADVDLSGCVLFVALYEDNVTYATAPGNNGQTVFHHMFRDRVDTPPALGALTAGQPVEVTVSLNRGAALSDDLTVIAFVQRTADHAVLQAGSVQPPDPDRAVARP